MWSYNYQEPNELYHHGVIGMKWGVRRSIAQLRKTGGSKKKTDSGKNDEKETPKKKTSRDMSDEELRAAINRKRLENDYNNLYPAQVSKGKKFADAVMNKVIVPAATEAGKNLLKDVLTNQGKKMLKLPIGGDSKKDKD